MSKRQDRQGVRTPADVERKYNLGGLRDMMSRIAAEASGSEAVDALSKEVAALEKVVENTASEMWQTQGEMQESLEDMQGDMTIVKQDFLNTAADVDDLKEDMTPLAEFSDGEYSGVVGFVARANADSATIATLLEFSQDDDISLAMFMAEASKEFATIESVTKLENSSSQALTGFKQEVARDYATIAMLSSYVDKEAHTEAIAGLRQDVAKDYATQQMLTGYVDNKTHNEAYTGLKQYADGKFATTEILSSYVSKDEQTATLNTFRQTSDKTYAKTEVLSSYKSETDNSIAGLKTYVDGTFASSSSITQLQTEMSNQKTAILQEVGKEYASVSQIAEVVDEHGKVTAAAIVAQINEGKSSILLEADAIDLKGYVTITGLEGGSTTIDGACIKTGTINADRIDATNLKVDAANVTGTLKANQIEGIEITVQAADIQGKLTAEQIDATELKVDAANVTGTLVIGQLPSTVAETSDIPTKLSALENDSGFQNESGVTSIVGGVVTTDFIEALNIKVSSAQISDTLTIGQLPSTVAEKSEIPTNVSDLTNDSGFQNASGVTSIVNGTVTTDFVNALGITAKRIDVDSLSAITANIGEVTAGVIRSENPFSAFRIDLTNGTMSMNGLTLDAVGNLSVEGEIRAKSGYIGSASEGFAINSKYISGNGKPSYNGGTDNGVYVGADGIGLGRGTFWVNDAGYLHTESGSIGNLDITDTGLAWGDVFTLDETGVNFETSYKIGNLTYHDRSKIYDGGVYSQLEVTENGVTVGNHRAGLYAGGFFFEETPTSSINPEHQIMRVKLGQTDYEIYVNTQTMTLGFREGA